MRAWLGVGISAFTEFTRFITRTNQNPRSSILEHDLELNIYAPLFLYGAATRERLNIAAPGETKKCRVIPRHIVCKLSSTVAEGRRDNFASGLLPGNIRGQVVSAWLSAFLQSSEHIFPSGVGPCSLHAPRTCECALGSVLASQRSPNSPDL